MDLSLGLGSFTYFTTNTKNFGLRVYSFEQYKLYEIIVLTILKYLHPNWCHSLDPGKNVLDLAPGGCYKAFQPKIFVFPLMKTATKIALAILPKKKI